MKTLTLTLLANNVVQRPGLLAEHGLAFWLDCGGHRLLVPLHCTGDAVSRLKTEFPDACRLWGVGDSMTFELKEGGKK